MQLLTIHNLHETSLRTKHTGTRQLPARFCVDNDTLCKLCDKHEPEGITANHIFWIDCDKCGCWVHTACAFGTIVHQKKVNYGYLFGTLLLFFSCFIMILLSASHFALNWMFLYTLQCVLDFELLTISGKWPKWRTLAPTAQKGEG